MSGIKTQGKGWKATGKAHAEKLAEWLEKAKADAKKIRESRNEVK